MQTCQDCRKPIEYGRGFGSVCHSCRGKRAGKVNREKRDKHGPAYHDRRSADAHR